MKPLTRRSAASRLRLQVLVVAGVSAGLVACGDQDGVCGAAPEGFARLALADLAEDPGAWADERVALEGLVVVASTGCTAVVCDCCRQCTATLKITDGSTTLRLDGVSCRHDLCGGDCLLSVGAGAVRDGEPLSVHGTLVLTTARGPQEFVLAVEGACAVAGTALAGEAVDGAARTGQGGAGTSAEADDAGSGGGSGGGSGDAAASGGQGPDPTDTSPSEAGPGGGDDRSPPTHPAPAEGPVVVEPDDEAAFLFADGEPPIFEVFVSPADLAAIDADPQAEVYVPASVTFDGVTHEPVGLRYKGSVGSLTSCFNWLGGVDCGKLSMKLDFAEYEPERRFFGLKKLNFQAFDKDDSKLHERLAYHVFRGAGIAAPRSAHAWLIVNGVPRGLFGLTEQVDGRFTRARFPDGGEGNVYKEVWPNSIQTQPYLDALKTNRDEDPDVLPMASFAQALHYGGEAGRLDVIGQWTDADALFRYLAVDRVLGNWDGITQWYCLDDASGVADCFNHNYYWYQEEGLGRLWLIPWDMDHSLEFPNPLTFEGEGAEWTDVTDCLPTEIWFGFYGMAARCDPLLGALIGPGWPRFVSAAQDLLAADWFAPEVIEARLDTWASLIASSVAADAYGPTEQRWADGVQELRDDAWALRVELQALLAARAQP